MHVCRYEGEKIFDDDEGLKRIRDSPFSGSDPMLRVMGTEMFFLSLRDSISVLEFAGEKDLASRVTSAVLNQGKDKIYEMFNQRNKLTDVATFPCIIHGDLWVNNILLKYDAKGKPVSLKFVDFQQTRRGNIYEDLIYFIFTSTTPEFRKQYLVQVLNSYYESFAKTLGALGAQIPIGFSRGKLIDTFYEGILAGYVYMAFAIPMQLADPVDPKEKAEAMQQQMMNGGGAPPPDPSQMSPEQMMEMMMKGLEARSGMFYGQMVKFCINCNWFLKKKEFNLQKF